MIREEAAIRADERKRCIDAVLEMAKGCDEGSQWDHHCIIAAGQLRHAAKMLRDGARRFRKFLK